MVIFGSGAVLIRKRAKRAIIGRKERDPSRGSPRFLTAQERLFGMTIKLHH
jgi:hypothetical protein